MSLTLDDNSATYQIRAYKPGQIQINDRLLEGSIIIAPDKLIDSWSPQTLSELTAKDLTPLLEIRPAILLIGTGEKLVFPNLEVYGDLINHGIGVEIMNTHAACRTYNVLSAEGRNVAAALIIR